MFGGFPYIPNLLNDKEMIRDYLRGIYSTKKVSDTLTSGGRKTASATVENCYTALTESFLFYKATRYDIKGK